MTEKNAIDAFFDKAEAVVDKVVGGLSDLHHPDKQYEDAESEDVIDAVIETETIDFMFVHHGGGRHIARGLSCRTLCGRALIPGDIKGRSRLNDTDRSFMLFCVACVSKHAMLQSPAQKMLPEPAEK